MSFFNLAALRKKLHHVNAEIRATKNRTFPLSMVEDPIAQYWENIRRRLAEIERELKYGLLDAATVERTEAEKKELEWLVKTGTVRP